MSRGMAAALILVAWVGTLGWLAERRLASGGRRGSLAQHVPPGAAYYKVSWGGRQVGLASITVDTLSPTDTTPAQVRLAERLIIVLAGPHGPERHELSTNLLLSTQLGVRQAEIQLSDAAGRATARLRSVGDSILISSIDSTGGPWRASQRINGPLLPLGALPIQLAYRERPAIGMTLSHLVLDPATLEFFALGVTVTGDSTFIIPDSVVKEGDGSYRVAKTDTVRAWRVALSPHGVATHAWYDVNGFPVRSWTGGGLDFERTAFEFANDGLKALTDSLHPPADLPTLPAEAGPGDSTLAASTLSWRVRLPGAEYADLLGAGPLQAFAGDTLALSRMPYQPLRDPMRPLQPIPMGDLRFLATLRGEPRLSPDDTALTALAHRIIGDETSARIAAARLVEWVHRNIAFEGGEERGWPTAAQVLQRRRGTAQGVATLTTALARRVGLPARVVGGLLLRPGVARRHTWVEVFIGDWVPVDPAFGQFPASPAHARLVIGASAGWAEYLPLAGALAPVPLPEGE